MSLADIKTGLAFYERFWRPAELCISDMERRGVGFYPGAAAAAIPSLEVELAVLEQGLEDWTGQRLGWGSTAQLRQLLYGTTVSPATKGGPPITPKNFNIPPVGGTLRAVKIRKDDDEPTGEAALSYLADHVSEKHDRAGLRTLLEWKKRRRVLSFWTSLPGFVHHGRIHGQIQRDAESGRLTMRKPNLQQQPPEVRSAFGAKPGHVLLARDYSGLEWRILAHVLAHRYGDRSLVEEIEAGIDPHSATAVRMGLANCAVELVKEQYPKARADAKILNYSINYGKTGAGLGVQIRGEDGEGIGEKAGQALLDRFFKARPGVARFQRDIVTYARGTGYVRSLLGRHRFVPDIEDDRRWVREAAERRCKNVIQNCAADIVELAMLRCNTNPELQGTGWYNPALARLRCDLVLSIHDELLFEVPEENAEEAGPIVDAAMTGAMEGVRDFLCPLAVEGHAGPDWRTACGK